MKNLIVQSKNKSLAATVWTVSTISKCNGDLVLKRVAV